jgi:hypothetical protein
VIITGRPGKSWSLVTAPINQNGTERAKTNKKNIRGDLLRDAMGFDEPLSIDCGNVDIRRSSL